MRPPRNYFVRSFERETGMLSRVADGLYWMSRYLERAEHSARLVDVELQLWLDQSPDAGDRKSTRLNSSHTEIYTLSLHDALPICGRPVLDEPLPGTRGTLGQAGRCRIAAVARSIAGCGRSEEHTSELQSHRDLHSFPTRRSSDLRTACTG